MQYNPKLLEKWASAKLNSIDKEKVIFNKSILSISIFLAFLAGFTLSLPLVYIDNIFPKNIELFSNTFYQKWAWIIGVSIVVSIIEVYVVFRINIFLAYNLVKKYGYDFDRLKDSYILGFDFLISRFVIDAPEPKIELLGIDAYKNQNRYIVIVKKLIYKLRITLTNAISKLIVRKLILRNGVRVSVEWVSAVVIGFWNGFSVYLFYRKLNTLLVKMQKIDNYLNKLQLSKKENIDIFYRILGNIFVLSGENRPELQYFLFEFSKKYKITKKDDCDLDCNIELRDSIKNSTIETKKIYKDFFDFCIDVVGIKDKKVEKVLGDMWQK